MLNSVSVVGRLTKDPQIIYTEKGVPITTFCLAVQRTFKNKATGKYEADFVDCIQFYKAAENTANLGKKGMLCSANGRIQKRSYVNGEGKKVYTTEVIVDILSILESKGSFNNQNQTGAYSDDDVPDAKGDEYKGYDLETDADGRLPF